MTENKKTAVGVSLEEKLYAKLKKGAEKNSRSIAGELRHLIIRAHGHLYVDTPAEAAPAAETTP
jgi:hypothetical protein